MRRMLSIAAIVLVLAQAMSAAVPMLHQPPAKPSPNEHGNHDCCPKPVVEVRDCCPKTISCPHQRHPAGACCCVDSGDTGIPARTASGNKPAPAALVAYVISPVVDGREWLNAVDIGPPLDNSPPILVLRN